MTNTPPIVSSPRHKLWMDSLVAPLNPCSLETLPEAVELADGSKVWPTMLSMYQLFENERLGQMNLYMIPVPDIESNLPSLPLSFKEPYIVTATASGVLDGKWRRMPEHLHYKSRWAFASAHASGEIRIHCLRITRECEGLEDTASALLASMLSKYDVIEMGQSYDGKEQQGDLAICLSIQWDQSIDHNENCQRIISTYSNGRVSVHDVMFSEHRAELVEVDNWEAHSLFSNPTEVWTGCFSGSRYEVLTGGDDGKLKAWDLRATTRPTQILQNFEAGVTCLSSHPRHEYMVGAGSYDERVSLYDSRYLLTPICHTKPLGGGIWRIQWHPYTDHRVLVAAMHGGCRVLNFKRFQRYCLEHAQTKEEKEAFAINPSTSWASSVDSSLVDTPIHAKSKKKFREHESLVYGAGWMVCRHPKYNESYFEAAASCSFYDRSVFLWDSVL